MDLKFEPGKLYQTRGKQIAKCCHVFYKGLVIWAHDESEHVWTTGSDGRYYSKSNVNAEWDIIGEYVEPRRWKVYVYEGKLGRLYTRAEREPTPDPCDWTLRGIGEVVEGEGLDA